MAQLYESGSSATETEKWLRKAVDLHGSETEARVAYARWLMRQNRPDAALKQLQANSSNSATDANSGFMIGLCHRMQGDFDDAERVFSRRHQKEPTNVIISNQLALVLIESADEGRRGRALQISQSNAQRFPNEFDLIATLGWVNFRLGNTNEANRLLTLTTRTGKISRDTAYFLSRIRREIGDKAGAKTFEKPALTAEGEFYYLEAVRENSDKVAE